MIFRVRSLFLKIFLWFWATVIVTGIALVVTWIIFQPRNFQSSTEMNLADTAWISGAAAVDRFERQGAPAATSYMEDLNRKAHLRSCLFDIRGNALAGTHCESLEAAGQHQIPPGSPGPPGFPPGGAVRVRHGFRVAFKLGGNNGRQYVYVAETAERRGPPPGISHAGIALRWSVALLVSGFICYLLTRYLTTPILRLREASQHLAAGDLSARASAGMERRRDDLGLLVHDFNSMANRIEGLVSRQRQLIYDISHELRSPLARLNVALDLGRQRKGDDPAFHQAERDIACLDEMIERLLTMARLDASTAPISMASVDLTALVEQIVSTAAFELQDQEGTIHLSAQTACVVHGNEELLHSAIENVIRNAVRYTGHGNSVEVSLDPTDDRAFARLLVRDHGQGVPERDLQNIFQPFYRVANDRNRQSGGTGLGLAIADRVVRIHHGTIAARNVKPNGLEVEIRLPLISRG
jgi:two-component system, OmpR family, sensor histidine kinase CpxA